MSASALASMSTTGSRTVASVTANVGRVRCAVATPPPSPLGSSSVSNRCGACTSTQRAASRAKSGPAMITVGMATSTPSPSVMPRLALRAATATSGPGWGGTSPCMADRPASAGMPTFISDSPERRETRKITGISSTRPISKNIGSPMSAPTSAMAHGSVRVDERPTMVSTIWSAPPESASSLPNIAPRAINVPTLAAVEPNPLLKLVIAASSAIPATAATTSEPIVSARNGCTENRVIRTTMTAMPTSAAMTSWAPFAGGAAAWARRPVATVKTTHPAP